MKNRRDWNKFVFFYLFGSCSTLWKSLGLIRVESPQFPRAASQQVPGTNAKRKCFVQYFPFETRSILPAHHGCLTVPTYLVRHKHRNFCQIWRATIAEYLQNLGCQDQEKQPILPKFFWCIPSSLLHVVHSVRPNFGKPREKTRPRFENKSNYINHRCAKFTPSSCSVCSPQMVHTFPSSSLRPPSI